MEKMKRFVAILTNGSKIDQVWPVSQIQKFHRERGDEIVEFTSTLVKTAAIATAA